MRSALRPSAREWLRRLSAGELTARELVTHVLERIDEVNPRLNALVARDDEAALAAADAADEARRAGDARPLLGLPVTIKDSIETAGLVSAGGSHARAGFVPERDATVVARLRAAGAIVVGKTNVPEYTWSYETENALYGRTGNPHDVERTCGGSSGGEAALLGADASVVGVGTDGGGSIRVPSHFCGTAGLRPTAGLVPETGCWPPTRDTGMLDMNAVGPMARHVEDLALLLPVLAGRDDVDPFVQGVPVGDPATVDVSSLRVGFYTDDGFAPVGADTEAWIGSSAAAFADLGSIVEFARPPDVSEATELFFSLMAADGGEQARRDLGDGPHVEQLARLLDDLRPLARDAAGYFDLVRRLIAFRTRVRAFVSRYDVVLAPVTIGPAPRHVESYDAFNYTHTYSLAGLPVVVIPIGDVDGLPIGMQIVANPFHDHVALAAAGAFEA